MRIFKLKVLKWFGENITICEISTCNFTFYAMKRLPEQKAVSFKPKNFFKVVKKPFYRRILK